MLLIDLLRESLEKVLSQKQLKHPKYLVKLKIKIMKREVLSTWVVRQGLEQISAAGENK